MIYWLIALFHLVIMSVAALHALICKRDHRTALGWIAIIIIFPIAGPVLYFLFGINRVRSKARLFAGKHLPVLHFGYERAARIPADWEDPLIAQLPLPHLAVPGGRATGKPLVAGNDIRVLHNGEQLFPRLVEAMDQARQFVLLSSYLFSTKGGAAQVVEALQRAAARGVAAYVLIDGIGAWYSLRQAVKPLRRAGVRVSLFRPPGLLPPSLDINLRNHRKIVVVDNQRAFFGGTNIDHRHMVADPANKHATEDLHFEAGGPVVEKLRQLFAQDWRLATGEALALSDTTPTPAGNIACRVIDDGPDDSLNHLSMTLIGMFTSARESITIMVPYFLPAQDMMAALQSARMRGVRVRLLLPKRSNLRFMDWATRNMLWELLVWNVEVYFKAPPFAHTKLVVVDSHYVMGGSANLDARSLRLNFELGVEMLDTELAELLEAHMESAIRTADAVSLEELDNRPFWQRTRDAFFWLFSSYL